MDLAAQNPGGTFGLRVGKDQLLVEIPAHKELTNVEPLTSNVAHVDDYSALSASSGFEPGFERTNKRSPEQQIKNKPFNK